MSLDLKRELGCCQPVTAGEVLNSFFRLFKQLFFWKFRGKAIAANVSNIVERGQFFLNGNWQNFIKRVGNKQIWILPVLHLICQGGDAICMHASPIDTGFNVPFWGG